MASVVTTFASLATLFPTSQRCGNEKVLLNSSSVQLGAARQSSTSKTFVSKFVSSHRSSKKVSCSSCRASLYHVASSFSDIDYPISLRMPGSSWSEPSTTCTGERSYPGSREWMPRVNRREMKVRASRGDMLGNNNVRFSPTSGTSAASSEVLRKNHVPLYVVIPSDTVTSSNKVNRARALQASLKALKIVGVDGVLLHIWWGNVEGEGPQKYDWSAYLAVVKMVNAAGLKLQASLCFHGSSISGDSCDISLPSWVLRIGEGNPDIFHSDRSGHRSKECLSLAVDELPLFEGRSPLQMYSDLMESFRQTFSLYLGDTIVEVMVGLGPGGELKYPAFPDDLWRFPGIGEFQCYDKYMLEDLKNQASLMGKPEWGLGGPEGVGSYHSWPGETTFFNEDNGTWDTPFGKFFLSWYAGALVSHGDRMLALAGSIFQKDDLHVVIAGKLPGVHWWQKTKAHAAELTTGYHNSEGMDGYDLAVQMFAKNGALLTVSCMEMADDEQLAEAKCSPEHLLLQIRFACAKYGVPISGENSLIRFDEVAHERIKKNVHRVSCPELPRMAAFTFFRMGESLFQSSHWRLFVNFVQTLNKDIVDDSERASLDEECNMSVHPLKACT
ncbi:beta-amylase [Marchantia polymorpha subsp. ruderalis]